jgi:hypothetical protein
MPRKLTPLTDQDNIMVVWQDEPPAAKRPTKKAAPKKAKRTS